MIRSVQVNLLFLLLLLPGFTFLHIWPLNSLLPDGGTLLVVSILFALTLIRAAGLRELPFSLLALLPLAMLLPFLISHLANDVVLRTPINWAIISLVLTALLVIVAEQLRYSNTGFQSLLARGFMVSGGIYALFALVQHYGLLAQLADLPAPDAGRLKGGWQQPNLTTSTLWVTLFAAAYVNRNKNNLVAMVTFSLIVGATLALAASRLNVVLVPFALAISGWLLWSKRTDHSVQGRQLVSGTLVVLVCLFAVPEISAPLEQELVKEGWIGKGNSVSLIERRTTDHPRVNEFFKIANSLESWSVKEWLFGQGVGQYGTFSYHQPVVPLKGAVGQGAWLHSHNLFSMILVEIGLLGLLTLSVIIGILLYTVWQQRHTEWGIPAIGGLGVVFVHSMVEYPLWYPWYLVVTILLAVPLFRARRVSVTSPWLFSTAGGAALVVIAGLAWNLGGQARTILETAVRNDTSEIAYRRLALLANDGLLGPYAVLAKYRRFSPETINFDWQLSEARRISEWRPLDVVQLREVTLLLMMGKLDLACTAAREIAQRYPATGPIVLEKAILIKRMDASQLANLSGCVEEGLQVWGETLESMQKKNYERTNN
ncbi:Wzy polymerase domain-containing protein [Marinobacter sp.]|uniref:PglL family O-oligosaccharyltransferase n=1 Tax=Marinobacter sp. TaxID=50741 RepID=UPI003B52DABA